jgi:CubicO group peptidase (beta-lactamase class C family)
MSTKKNFPISGQVATGFEPVRAAFEKNFSSPGEVGAALHVTLNGETVVDLWGGAADAAGTRPWMPDSLVNVWSTTKGWLALAMNLLADRGQLDFDAPVSHYWPEFAQKGKETVLVRHILTHTAGLPAPSVKVPDEAVYDWETMVHSLEQSELFWEPGKQCGYHAATFGWLNGEVLRRITGKSVGEFLRSEIAGPLAADVFIGLNPDEEARTADTIAPPQVQMLIFRLFMAYSGRAAKLAFSNPPRPPKAANTHRWRQAQIPSSNGHTSARGLARLYTVLAMGGKLGDVRLLSEEGAALAGREQVRTQDCVTGGEIRRSLGYMILGTEKGDPLPLSAFGHPGMGGSIGFADPQHKLAVGYVMNRMINSVDPRNPNLCRAIYACLKD